MPKYSRESKRNLKKKTKQDSSKKILELCLWYLSRRSRSEQEIRQRLSRKNFSDDEISSAIGWLVEKKFLCDEEFAKNYISSARRVNPKGDRRIFLELRKKGVSKEIIEEELSKNELQDELGLARESLKPYLRKNSSTSCDKAYRRTLSYLLRRGFSYDSSKQAVSEALRNED